MLFNSFSFLFFYLPIVLAGYFLLGRLALAAAATSTDTATTLRRLAPAAWLACASLFFYGWWDVRYLPLLLASISINYAGGRLIGASTGAARRRMLIAALLLNLALLAWYKYANFFVDSVNALAAMADGGRGVWPSLDVVLPIGISFFTFTQIAFLVDCYRGEVREYRFIHYLLFVSYFPHLIAGPVLHHRDMMPQFADPASHRPQAANFAIGLSIFVVGLAKKVLIADNLSPLALPVFATGAQPTLIEAWIGVLAYTFQLYFDFSGYSDMAIGLSRLFGVKLPLNFNSPYKACNIAEFWRRWHMTLSRFLRDYLYIALGGSRHGEARRYRNLLLTMLLGGLWHGAGWTFVVWGALHGLYLVVQSGWQRAFGVSTARWWPAALTLFAVMLAWIFFRAPDLATAWNILGALFGANGVSLPRGAAGLAPLFAGWAWQPAFDGIRWIQLAGPGLPVLLLAMLLALRAPNTQEIFSHYQPCIETILQRRGQLQRWQWRPTRRWSMGFAALFVLCIFGMNRVTEFLYFQF